MTLAHLENLVRIQQLKIERPDQGEFDGMVRSARRRLIDAQLDGLSTEGCFTLAYSAAHGLALAALRWHGFRSESRYLAFQCLEHTVGLEKAKWRVFVQCHKLRNLAEYEGQLEISPQLLADLIMLTDGLLTTVEGLGPVSHGLP